MTKEHRIILNAIEDALTLNPNLRFGQALFNLGINEFVNRGNPGEDSYRMRDIHGDKDAEVVARIKKTAESRELQLKVMAALENPELKNIHSMTVNERLAVSGLMDDFDKYRKSDLQIAQFILLRLKVDQDSIEDLLKLNN